jgi:hypothetical protein
MINWPAGLKQLAQPVDVSIAQEGKNVKNGNIEILLTRKRANNDKIYLIIL